MLVFPSYGCIRSVPPSRTMRQIGAIISRLVPGATWKSLRFLSCPFSAVVRSCRWNVFIRNRLADGETDEKSPAIERTQGLVTSPELNEQVHTRNDWKIRSFWILLFYALFRTFNSPQPIDYPALSCERRKKISNIFFREQRSFERRTYVRTNAHGKPINEA